VSAPSTDSFSAEVANRIIQCDDHGEVDALVTSLVNSPDFVRPVFVRVVRNHAQSPSIYALVELERKGLMLMRFTVLSLITRCVFMSETVDGVQ
jgi:uncharacterized OB-fold protein